MKQKDTLYISVKKSSIFYWSKVIVLGVVLGTGLQFADAWSEPGPGVVPPDGNVAGPITTSDVTQTKIGRLILSSDLATQSIVDLNNGFRVDPSGTSTFSTVHADMYYDRQAPSYYLDPGNTSNTNRMQAQTICLGGACRTTWPSSSGDNLGNHIATTNLNMAGNNIANVENLFANILYDRNNNGYYLNPDNISRLNDIRPNIIRDPANVGYYLDPGNTSNTNRMQAQTICLGGACRTTWPSSSGDNLGNHIATTTLNMNSQNIGNISTSYHVRGVASADFRAPIFYDTDNTTYYANPTQTSNFNLLNIRGGTINFGNEGSKIVRSDASNWTSFQSASGHALVAYDNGITDLRYGGSAKIRTENYGVSVIGKARSTSTSAGDPGNTLATKDYVDAQSGGGGCYVATPSRGGSPYYPAVTSNCVSGFSSQGTYTCAVPTSNSILLNYINGTCRVCCK
jgi:hypothetical protein